MQKMTDFSVETDDTVLVSFQDGSQRRVGVKQLARQLLPGDVGRIRRALKLRHSFLRQHMPYMIAGSVVVSTLILALAMPDAGPMSELAHPAQTRQHHPRPAKPAAYLETPAPTPPSTNQVDAATTSTQVVVAPVALANPAAAPVAAPPADAPAVPAVGRKATTSLQTAVSLPTVPTVLTRLLQP